MMCCKRITTEDPAASVAQPRAVAYYRQSAQEPQDNSIPAQREQVREWAEKSGVEIIEEFSDPGKSQQTAPGP